MLILNGKIVRDEIKAELARAISKLSVKPKLVIIQVGDRAESNAYIEQKKIFGGQIGAVVEHCAFDKNVTEEEVKAEIVKHNADKAVHGIIIQMPIPKHLDFSKLVALIDPAKDVDGLTPANLKKLMEHDASGFIPATAKGVVSLLDYYQIPIAGRKVVVVGRSILVGKSTALALLGRDATVTVCHSKTRNLSEETKRAEILIVATGHPLLITEKHVSPGQVVVDVGINLVSGEHFDEEIEGKKFTGDVDFDAVKDIVGAISPVPGGVGPMTVASLFENLVKACK